MRRMLLALVVAVGLAGGVTALWPHGAVGAPRATAVDPKLVTQAIRVEGVDCAGCTVAIRHALKKLDGVRDVQADEANKAQLLVTFDPARVQPEKIVATVNELGFKASLAAAAKGA